MACQQPFFNPILPFTGAIQGALYEGKSITVSGRVLPGAQRFHVNLKCGSIGNPDIALHFNIRYEGFPSVLVCNTLQSSNWGSEERVHPAPLTQGANFTLMFLVNKDFYSLILNGSHFMNYLHRLPFSRVNTISVDGGVEILSIAFSNPTGTGRQNQKTSFQRKTRPQRCGASKAHLAASFSPGHFQAPPPYTAQPYIAVPYKNILAGGVYPGKNITVQGTVNYNAERFAVNLRFNSGVALHFNPRFNDNVVVRNSFLNESWGPEEKIGGMPFFRGQPFMLTIICDTQYYRVMVNGAQMFTYNHRHFLFQQIDILEVDGDVSLSSVQI
ncbi:galectin-9 isoform X2 [Esox lucius]|uniref:Galectin n=1 Tax=Esox lucius TaxID=8010 RepID=A0AAY5KNY5_ESOLU|nr:galectin-9 isoform X2 [Esox lucius]